MRKIDQRQAVVRHPEKTSPTQSRVEQIRPVSILRLLSLKHVGLMVGCAMITVSEPQPTSAASYDSMRATSVAQRIDDLIKEELWSDGKLSQCHSLTT